MTLATTPPPCMPQTAAIPQILGLARSFISNPNGEATNASVSRIGSVVLLLVVAPARFFIALFLNHSVFSSFDAYDEVPIPGT
jgi:hypothetical protein